MSVPRIARGRGACRGAAVVAGAGLALATLTASADAQMPDPSAAAVGTAGSYGALARGLSATHWNAAGLAMPGAPRFSISILPVRVNAGLGPVGLGDVAAYDGELIPQDVRERWVQAIERDGGQRGQASGKASLLAVSFGRVGLQIGTETTARADIDPSVARAILLGNAVGDSAVAIQGLGSHFQAHGVSTAALAYAHPLPLGKRGHLALGATFTYSVGHLLVSGEGAGPQGGNESAEISVRFPTIVSFAPDSIEGEGGMDKGRGVGLDLAAAWQRDRWRVTFTIDNLVNTFAWDEAQLFYTPASALFSPDTADADFALLPLAEAPDSIHERLDELGFAPLLGASGAVEFGRAQVVADVRRRLTDGLSAEPATHVGAGVVYRPVDFLPLRAGLAYVSGGYRLGAGVGLQTGGVSLDLAGGVRRTEWGRDYLAALTLSFGMGGMGGP